MRDLIDAFLQHIAAEEKRQKTLVQYGGNLRRLERWLGEHERLALDAEHIASVTGMMLTGFYQSLHADGLKGSTRNAYVIAIKEFFGFLKAAQVISEDPSCVLHCVKEKKRPADAEEKRYTDDELQELLNALADDSAQRNALRDMAIIALILGSGLRAFEICGLNVSHLDGIRGGVIMIERKGGGWEQVHVADFVYAHIARYLLTRRKPQPNDPLFLSQKGNRMTPNSIWKTLASKQRQLSLHTGVHRFRHTFLSEVEHSQKGGAALARDLAGHKSVRITNTYLHTTPEERKDAVNHMGYAKHLSV